jgi:ferrochelatase
MTKTAVVLFNLGGPDSLQAVRPFLFNLFYDKAILAMPNPFRWVLAQFISRVRHKKAQGIYARMGGKSPLLENTVAQQQALERALGNDYKVFVAMRYWYPLTDETVKAVQAYDPDQVILLPLYPHFSTTTTGSSNQEWNRVAKAKGFNKPTRSICCFPLNHSFIQAHVDSMWPVYEQAQNHGPVRVLFSAHSLPQKVIDAGDPYQWQTEQCVQRIIDALEKQHAIHVDWRVCYQSKVGPVQWLQPTLDSEIDQAAHDGVALVVVPISFVSDHSETLVELDMDFFEKAQNLGIPFYGRVPSLATHEKLVDALVDLVKTQVFIPVCPAHGYVCPCLKKQISF